MLSMQGASDGGKYIEALRTEHMKPGRCELRATGCEGYSKRLERHHEKYSPERCIYVCHHCHHLLHFRPYQLTEQQKKKLLETRHGSKQWSAFTRKPNLMHKLVRNYVAPGRRPAQLILRRKLRRKRQVEDSRT